MGRRYCGWGGGRYLRMVVIFVVVFARRKMTCYVSQVLTRSYNLAIKLR